MQDEVTYYTHLAKDALVQANEANDPHEENSALCRAAIYAQLATAAATKDQANQTSELIHMLESGNAKMLAYQMGRP